MSGNKNNSDEKLIRALYKKAPLLHWGKLRFVGSIRVLSVMSFFGASIAAGLSLPQLSQININDIISSTIVVWSFIAFIMCLLFANLTYFIFCPAIIRKFASLSDFYMHQINIKKCQLETYPDDKFDADMIHVSKQYIKDLSANNCARRLSVSLFIASIIFLLVFVISFIKITFVASSNLHTINSNIIYFKFNSSDLTNIENEKLDIIYKSIKLCNGKAIVKGYADDTGSAEHNFKLSTERANSIKKYLAYKKGLNAMDIAVVGYGSLWPIASNRNEEGRKFNRRAEVEIVPQNKLILITNQ